MKIIAYFLALMPTKIILIKLINERKEKILNKKIPDFDVLAEDPKIVAVLIQQNLDHLDS